jgi:Ca2+-binding EF-hand superfamily protein
MNASFRTFTTSASTLCSIISIAACGGAAELEAGEESRLARASESAQTAAPAPGAASAAPLSAEGHGKGEGRHKRHGRGHGPKNPDKLFERFDENKNGTLEPGEVPDRMKDKFADIDTDKNNVLSKEEVTAHFKARMLERGKRHFERKDTNRDGFLDQNELGKRWEKLRVADANGDQKLTLDELRAAFEAGKLGK